MVIMSHRADLWSRRFETGRVDLSVCTHRTVFRKCVCSLVAEAVHMHLSIWYL